MKYLETGLLLFLLSMLSRSAAAAAPAQGRQERRLQAVRIDEPIVVDGELNEPAWRLAQPAADFIQKLPRTGEPASERTEVRLLYDQTSLYVGAYCFDSAGPKGIVVNDITRDFVTVESDGFQVVLDTFDDNRNSFLFGTNPKAGRFDMQIGADGNAGNTDWDGIWFVETKITEQGWQVEMAIPFKTLRFRRNDAQTWGVNFERRVRRKFEDSYWSPLPPPYRLGRVSLAGALEGIQGIRQGRNLYVKPYLAAPIVRREEDDVDFIPDAGLDVKYGLSSQLTLDLTANTDFSQVEVDEEQINFTRFRLFFPEKRDFFLENAGIFEFGRRPRRHPRTFLSQKPDLIPFFSRRLGISEAGKLVPIHGGVRLSGRAGRYTLGLLSMQAAGYESAPSANFSVLRIRRDVFRQSDVGAIFVQKDEPGEHFNRTSGVDANLTFFQHLDVSSYLLKSSTPEIHDRDRAANFALSWRDDFLDLEAGHLFIDENFTADAGFVPRRGMRKSSGRFGLTPRPEKRVPWLRELQPAFNIDYITDPAGVLETRRVESRFSVTFSDSSFLSVARESSFERLEESFLIGKTHPIPAGDYVFSQYSAYFQSDRSRKMSVEASLGRGGFYEGSRDTYGVGLALQPSYQFSAVVSWQRNDVSFSSGDFRTHLVAARLNYSFSTRLFLNALVQYNSEEKEISSNLRFNFIHRPLSDLFMVYNERRSVSGEVLERALVAKLTYMFSF